MYQGQWNYLVGDNEISPVVIPFLRLCSLTELPIPVSLPLSNRSTLLGPPRFLRLLQLARPSFPLTNSHTPRLNKARKTRVRPVPVCALACNTRVHVPTTFPLLCTPTLLIRPFVPLPLPSTLARPISAPSRLRLFCFSCFFCLPEFSEQRVFYFSRIRWMQMEIGELLSGGFQRMMQTF